MIISPKAITRKVLIVMKKGIALVGLGKYKDAAECFNKARTNIFKVFTFSEETAKIMLDDDDFFKEATEQVKKEYLKTYKEIYLQSFRILKTLQIKENTHETRVAHYTTKKVAQILFFDKYEDDDKKQKPSHFRLNSVTNSNDMQEGKTLFNYLFDNQKIRPQPEQFVAFVGCFMFNHDNLNQFRLYGKDEETKLEGTGISIVMKPDFFP